MVNSDIDEPINIRMVGIRPIYLMAVSASCGTHFYLCYFPKKSPGRMFHLFFKRSVSTNREVM